MVASEEREQTIKDICREYLNAEMSRDEAMYQLWKLGLTDKASSQLLYTSRMAS